MGVSTVGSGLGTVIIAPMISLLLTHYAYQGAMIIVGGLMLNNLVSAALYRPVADNYPKPKKPAIQELKNLKEDNNTTNDLAKDANVPQEKDGNLCSRCFSKMQSQFAIMTNVTFLLYGLQITAMSICIQTFLTFLPGLALEYGVVDNKQSASFFLSYMGLADMAGRLLIGFPMDLKTVSMAYL